MSCAARFVAITLRWPEKVKFKAHVITTSGNREDLERFMTDLEIDFAFGIQRCPGCVCWTVPIEQSHILAAALESDNWSRGTLRLLADNSYTVVPRFGMFNVIVA